MVDINFLQRAEQIKQDLIKWRRNFHMNPELDYDLCNTTKYIEEFLQQNCIEYNKVAKSGICAIIRGKGNKTIALRADMDALPLEDRKEVPYASKTLGKMHACGHDAHTAILMGAAVILNELKDKLQGNVKLFFEPAEETTGGALLMIKEGVMENPHVDGVVGLHVDENIACGKIGVKMGAVNAASDSFKVKIIGKGGHGARPDTTIDPIFIASSIIVNLQSIISRELPPTSPGVVTVGCIQGGTANNIIPEEVYFKGTIRTMKTEHRHYVRERFKEIVEGMVKSLRGECTIEMEESYPCLYNNDDMVKNFLISAEEVMDKKDILDLDAPSMGVESFAYFSMERPGVFYNLGVRNESKGIIHPAHGSLFDVDEESLALGAALQSKFAWDYLNTIDKE